MFEGREGKVVIRNGSASVKVKKNGKTIKEFKCRSYKDAIEVADYYEKTGIIEDSADDGQA